MLIHQFHPAVHNGDAIGEQIIAIRNLARDDGYAGEVFCVYPDREYRAPARLFDQYAPYSSAENILLLHYGIGYSDAVWQWLESIPDRKVVVYHNITPPHYFAGISAVYYAGTQRGYAELGRLRQLAPRAWCDSVYNANELRAAGWADASVLPIVFDPCRYDIAPDRATLQRLNDNRRNFLYVGRLAPNKCIEDILIVFQYLRRRWFSDARLWLIGSDEGLRRYRAYLDALVLRLGLRDVTFTGHISQAQVAAYYRSASIYISMSEHEGFGMPLIESMYYGVPVVAYDAAAIAETMGGCGVLVQHKNHAVIAEQIAQLLSDTAMRERIITAQRQRVAAFHVESVRPAWRAALRGVLEAAG